MRSIDTAIGYYDYFHLASDMSKAILAIDPGTSGGIAFRSADGKAYSMPNPKDDAKFVKLIKELNVMTKGNITAYVEKVGGFIATNKKGQQENKASAHTMFNFGNGFGFMRGALMATGIEYELILPQQWQSALDLEMKSTIGKDRWKNYLKDEAQKLFPEQKVTLKTADALLLLTYGELDQNRIRLV